MNAATFTSNLMTKEIIITSLFSPEWYHLATDNDGHWYIIKKGDEDKFDAWVTAMEYGEKSPYNFESINMSPTAVLFKEFKFDDER